MEPFFFLQQRARSGRLRIPRSRLFRLLPGRFRRGLRLVFTGCKREIRMVFERKPLLGPAVEDGRIMLHLTALHGGGEIVDGGECAFLARGEPDQVHGTGPLLGV
ncbi:MAG TPA: hypothetical protein VF151_04100 [Gemmatimonadales bacterium]